jgi:hypothetical protein
MLTNITFSIDPFLLKQARGKAATEHKALNLLFRQWVASYVRGNAPSPQYRSLMKRLDYASPGRKFTREELNER